MGASKYPIFSIEDAFDQDDFAAYTAMTERMGKECQVVGDDLLVTNPTRVQTGIDQKMCNALLLKVNQIGSVTESIEASNMSQAAGWGVMVSCRSDRLAKYNQILRVEEALGSRAVFAGKHFRNP